MNWNKVPTSEAGFRVPMMVGHKMDYFARANQIRSGLMHSSGVLHGLGITDVGGEVSRLTEDDITAPPPPPPLTNTGDCGPGMRRAPNGVCITEQTAGGHGSGGGILDWAVGLFKGSSTPSTVRPPSKLTEDDLLAPPMVSTWDPASNKFGLDWGEAKPWSPISLGGGISPWLIGGGVAAGAVLLFLLLRK